jgi:hypothetical protein
VQELSSGIKIMPPVREIDLSDGLRIVMTGGREFFESRLNIQGRLAGVAGNLKKKEEKFNEWLQAQPPFVSTYALADYDLDHPVHTDPDNLPVWRWVDGDNVIEVIMWIAVHIFDDSPLTFTIKCQNKEIGPITGDWWL